VVRWCLCVALVLTASGCRLWFDPLTAPDAATGGDTTTPACGTGVARTVTFGERTTSDVKGVTSDAMVTNSGAQSTLNFGALNFMSVRDIPAEHSLVRFDLSALAGCNERVTRARLQLFLPDSGDQYAGTLEARVVLESWVEGVEMGVAAPGVTWHARDTGVPWMTPGGTAGAVTGSIGAPAVATFIDVEFVASDVQAWITDPSSNFGLLLTSPNGHWHPISHETATPEARPQLVLDLAP
jgi:hypothetical protein